jgi:hypothetical protein
MFKKIVCDRLNVAPKRIVTMKNKFFTVLLFFPFPAFAGEAECVAISKAFDAVASVPAYRQSITMKDQAAPMEAIIIGDMIYAKPDGQKWMKIRLKAGGRKGMLDQFMTMSAMTECKIAGNETLPAGEARIFEYMMAPPKGFPGVGDTPMKQQIWVGVADGLIHKLASDSIQGTMTYGAMEPPIP